MEGLPIKSQTEGIMFHVSPLLFPVHFFFSAVKASAACFAAFYCALPVSVFGSDSTGKVLSAMLFKWFAFCFIAGP